MLRKVSSIMRIPSQFKSSSWLISVLVHVALIIALGDAYPPKINHTNNEFKTFEFVIFQPKFDKVPQKETPKDIAKAVSKVASKVKPINVSKHIVVSKPYIISEAKIISQSKSVSEPEIISSGISKNKIKTIPKPNPNKETTSTDASFRDLAFKKPKYNDKTDLDEKLSSRFEKPVQHNRRLVNASESKSPTKQMGVSLNKTLATASATKQIQTKIFGSKKSDSLGKTNNKKTSTLDLLENTPDTKTASINADLYNQNQSIITQTQFSNSTTELAIKKQLLKNWAATIRNDIIGRTLETKLNSDVRISFKISRTGEILNIEPIGKSVTNESIKKFIDVIRTSGKFPIAPQGLKLDYVTFPVTFRSRG
jgi:hypothetical protein